MLLIKNVKFLTLALVSALHCNLFGVNCLSDFSLVALQDFCDSFAENMKPIICVIKDNKFVTVPSDPNATTTRRTTTEGWGWGWAPPRHRPSPPPRRPPVHGWGWEESSESDESFCSCDLSCFPTLGLLANDTSLRCKQCGNYCDVKTSKTTTCNCALVDPRPIGRRDVDVDNEETIDLGGNEDFRESRQMTPPSCNCTVTCAQREWRMGGWGPGPGWEPQERDPPFCIFNVTGLNPNQLRLGSVTCECCKSRATLNNRIPDFVCLCQQF